MMQSVSPSGDAHEVSPLKQLGSREDSLLRGDQVFGGIIDNEDELNKV
jgi:hypothetical protein